VAKRDKPGISIVGAGALARALAPALRRAGYPIREVVSRDAPASRERAGRLARAMGAVASPLRQAKLTADVVWLCVPDAAISGVARALAPRRDWRGRVVLHSSGALPSDELRALRGRGASVGSLHPMMTFTGSQPPALRGLTFAVEGDARAARVARTIARDFGGEVFAVRKQKKPLYHALGSFSSPLLIMLLSEAEQVGKAAGLPPAKVGRVIQAILRQTLENYFRAGAAAAFSGPIRRGDLVTVKRHLRELRKVPGAVEVYRALARASLDRLPVGRRREMTRLLAR